MEVGLAFEEGSVIIQHFFKKVSFAEYLSVAHTLSSQILFRHRSSVKNSLITVKLRDVKFSRNLDSY